MCESEAELELINPEAFEQILKCCEALSDKKAEKLLVLELGDLSSITDYFVLATGTSEPHLRALGRSVEDTMRDLGIQVLGADRAAGSGWLVVDAFDFIVHIFTERNRIHYNLEGLWSDARVIPVDFE